MAMQYDTNTILDVGPSVAPPGLGGRNASGRSWHNAQGTLSPLSGPVLTGDDDDLFNME